MTRDGNDKRRAGQETGMTKNGHDNKGASKHTQGKDTGLKTNAQPTQISDKNRSYQHIAQAVQQIDDQTYVNIRRVL